MSSVGTTVEHCGHFTGSNQRFLGSQNHDNSENLIELYVCVYIYGGGGGDINIYT